jgi:hypothetical protein
MVNIYPVNNFALKAKSAKWPGRPEGRLPHDAGLSKKSHENQKLRILQTQNAAKAA